jgi:hypothetical protein
MALRAFSACPIEAHRRCVSERAASARTVRVAMTKTIQEINKAKKSTRASLCFGFNPSG